MVPSSAEKINWSPPKSVVVPLKTMPDGAAMLVLFAGGGIVTTKGTCFLPSVTLKIFPLPSYRVDTPALLSEIQNGVGPCTKPQGLSRFLSIIFAFKPFIDATRLVSV